MNYAGIKGKFIQDKMNEGLTNKQAHSAWKNSDQKKELDATSWDKFPMGTIDDRGNIDRSYDSPWQDYAETADDL